jgi:hypothetical protein
VIVCIFSMNLLALATLLADPPQALWAVKESARGRTLAFFEPGRQFWLYLLFTQALYGMALLGAGVRFGSPMELFRRGPRSWGRTAYGLAILGCLMFALTSLRGYDIPLFLGIVVLVVAATSFFFGAQAASQSLSWSVETAALFIAFFAVVAFAHAGFEHASPPQWAMVPIVAVMTAWADNAAAFAVAYPQFAGLPMQYQVWCNLFPAVSFGASTPLGNGPQITALLVILVNQRQVTPGQVFRTWFREAVSILPYLCIWSVSVTVVLLSGHEPTYLCQSAIGCIALSVSWATRRAQRLFSRASEDTQRESLCGDADRPKPPDVPGTA